MRIYADGRILRESFVNATEGYGWGDVDTPLGHTYLTERDDEGREDIETGELFRHAQSEYGRCVGRCYVDGPKGTVPVGWVFQKRDRYEDTGETYLRETWVSVYDVTPARFTPVPTQGE